MLDNIRLMSPENGMDVIILSVNNPHQLTYWKDRLDSVKSYLVKKNAHIIVVLEDWPGGAGNGLGTLYAFKKARDQALKELHIDLIKLLEQGSSIAIYHTAGSGKRLSPLTGSEQGDKSSVKLSGLIGSEDSPSLITLLEAVIRQTSIYSKSRKGRVSVFWGDQIFIPSVTAEYSPNYHVDILDKTGMSANQQTWEEEQLDKYGLIGKNTSGKTIMIDKISFDELQELIQKKKIDPKGSLGVSLGSFSLSKELLQALLEEFNNELTQKKGKLDSDPHFWMATTLDKDTYVDLMGKKRVSVEEASSYYDRMQNFLRKNKERLAGKEYFGEVDVGKKCFWWDYGTIKDYFNNMHKVTQSNAEAQIMRQFFHIDKRITLSDLGSDVSIDQNSIVINCHINKGHIRNSVLIGVIADEVRAEESVVINTTAKQVTSSHSLLYNILEENKVVASNNQVITDTFLPNKNTIARITSTLDRDGKKDWKVEILSNALSYEEISSLNKSVNKQEVEKILKTLKDKIIYSIFNATN
jgi:hypothetical protein